MAEYDVGSGETYSTIADAIAAVISDIGGGWNTETRYINLCNGETFTETIVLDTGWCNRENPLVLRSKPGDAQATYNGEINHGTNINISYWEIHDLQGTIEYRPLRYTDNNYGFLWKNCDFDVNPFAPDDPFYSVYTFENCRLNFAGYIYGASRTNGIFYFENCEVQCANNLFYDFAAAQQLICRNSIFTALDSSKSLIRMEYFGARIDSRNCTFVGWKNIIEPLTYSNQSFGSWVFYNNIFKSITSIIDLDQADVNIGINQYQLTLDGNLYNDVTAIITDSTGLGLETAADLTELKALGRGWEENGTETTASFSSTTWENSGYYRLTGSISTAKNRGVFADIDGTAREKWSDIDPGAHQYAAATEDSGGPIRIVVPTNKKLTLP